MSLNTASPNLAVHQPVALERPDDRYDREELRLISREAVRQHNARLQHLLRTLGAVRVQVAFFRCPWPVTLRQYEAIRKKALDRWLRYMEMNGWQLVSPMKVYTTRRRTAHAMTGDWYSVPVLDEVEIPVAAAWKKRDLVIQRVEVPVADSDDEN